MNEKKKDFEENSNNSVGFSYKHYMGVRMNVVQPRTSMSNLKNAIFIVLCPVHFRFLTFVAIFKCVLSVSSHADISLFMDIVFTENIFFSVCQRYCIWENF